MKLILKQDVKLSSDRVLAKGEIVDRKSLPLTDEQVQSLVENEAAAEYRPDRQADGDAEVEVLRRAVGAMEAELAEARAEISALKLQLPQPENPLADPDDKRRKPAKSDDQKPATGDNTPAK